MSERQYSEYLLTDEVLTLDDVYVAAPPGREFVQVLRAVRFDVVVEIALEIHRDKIIARILRVLTREGYLVEEEGLTYVADTHGILDPENVLAPLQAASCTYRIAFGPLAGRKVLSWRYAARGAAPTTQALCARDRTKPWRS